jgi:hypothetical protein
MTKKRRTEELTPEELAEANGEPLPDREAMSVIRGVQPLPHPVGIEPVPDVSPSDDYPPLDE